MNGTGYRNRIKTACPYGHPYSPENTRRVTYKSGHLRICKACAAIRMRMLRADPEFRRIEQFKAKLRQQRFVEAMCSNVLIP